MLSCLRGIFRNYEVFLSYIYFMYENPYFKKMNANSDAKLLEIVEGFRDKYNPEAIAAAEEVLCSRNVSFLKPEIETDEVEVLTIEELRGQIANRLAKGENIQVIRADLKTKGVDIFEYADQDQEKAAEEDSNFGARRMKAGALSSSIVFICLLLMKMILRSHDNSGSAFVIGIGAMVVVISIALTKKR
jgi:hypothetical protein